MDTKKALSRDMGLFEELVLREKQLSDSDLGYVCSPEFNIRKVIYRWMTPNAKEKSSQDRSEFSKSNELNLFRIYSEKFVLNLLLQEKITDRALVSLTDKVFIHGKPNIWPSWYFLESEVMNEKAQLTTVKLGILFWKKLLVTHKKEDILNALEEIQVSLMAHCLDQQFSVKKYPLSVLLDCREIFNFTIDDLRKNVYQEVRDKIDQIILQSPEGKIELKRLQVPFIFLANKDQIKLNSGVVNKIIETLITKRNKTAIKDL